MEEREYEIDLRDLYQIIKKRLWMVIISVIFAGAVSAFFSFYIIEPVYESQTTIIVVKELDAEQVIQYNDVVLSQKLVKTYGEIVKSRAIAKEVIKNLGLDISAGALIEMTNVSPVKDTEIISISVQNTDPALAKNVANELASVFMERIVGIMNIDNVQVIDPAELPAGPIKPKKTMNISIAAVLGAMLGLAFIFLIEFLDKTIKTVEDIEKHLGLPVIGIIPTIDAETLAEIKKDIREAVS